MSETEVVEKPIAVEKEMPTGRRYRSLEQISIKLSKLTSIRIGPVDKRIYIAGLHSSVTEDQIQERFSKFGKVNGVTVAKNTDSKYIITSNIARIFH
jgi:RNA recognition motif-containing protein